MEVMPVCRIDEARFKVGEISKLLLKKYSQEVNAYVKEKKGEGPSLWK
jgi:hypothetical protein